MKVTCNDNFRGFKKGESFEIPIYRGVNYIVGPNGSGKSTIMHFIRAKRNSLKQETIELFDGMTKTEDTLFQNSDIFTVEGLDEYENVFMLDSIDDDPTSFINAATAYGLVNGGGLNCQKKSKGQKAQFMLLNFIQLVTNKLGTTLQDLASQELKDKKKCLFILDEIDEGLDLMRQSNFHQILHNICTLFNADVLCICHNSFCILCDNASTLVFDMNSKEEKTIETYIKEQTGLTIKIDKNDQDDNRQS